MNETKSLFATLAEVEQRIDKIMETCERQRAENLSLLARQEALINERAALISKNEQAKSKVEAMISRLKTMEQHA